jgi:hypothetical protein
VIERRTLLLRAGEHNSITLTGGSRRHNERPGS